MSMQVEAVRTPASAGASTPPQTPLTETGPISNWTPPSTQVTDGSEPWLHAADGAAAGNGLPPLTIYNGSVGAGNILQKSGGPASTDATATTAYKTVQDVEDYYKTQYGRNGWDNKGDNLNVIVHQTEDGKSMANAYWEGDSEDVHIGDGGPIGHGVSMKPLGSATDVLAHEFTHAVMQSSGVSLASQGQGGGLNESWADVIGTGIDNNWQMGASVMSNGTPIRDLSKPLYGDVKDIPKTDKEPHDLSSVPSYAAYLTAQSIGAVPMRNIWYDAMAGGYLKSGSRYAGAAVATEAAATELYGANSAQEQAVAKAWAQVGVTPSADSGHQATLAKALSRHGAESGIRPGVLPVAATAAGAVG